MESREERLKKLMEAKQKLQQRNDLPTIRKEDLGMSIKSNALSELKQEEKSVESRIEELSNSLATLRHAKEVIVAGSKKKTEVIFIIDKSGSVEGTESQVSAGIAKIISNEKSKGRNEFITTVLFNNKEDVICDRKPIDEVTTFYYKADGGTALYDTLIKQIKRTMAKQAKDTYKPDKTIVVISTDGLDNVSINSVSDSRKLIEDRTAAGWEFIFLGTNFNVLKEADRLGIKSSNAVEYDILRLPDNFKAIERALDDVYEKGTVTEDWSKPITDNKRLSSGENKQYKKLLGE
ncbi:MAG: hypothetical protein Q4E69_03405 [Bacilli bacterium]|nr:hypothetical protein [Bacilli bacterium]